MNRLTATLLLTVAALLMACSGGDSLDTIEARGELRVVSRNSPTTWYMDKGGATGFEYALAGLFAEELGVALTITPAFSLKDIFLRLSRREADFAAAGLALTGEREDAYPHSRPYYRLRPQVVYVAGTYRPRSVRGLAGMRILTLSGSSHSRYLEALKNGGFPDLDWHEVEDVDSMELLEQVNDGRADLAIIDSSEFEVQQSLYPRLKVAFDLGNTQDMVWYLAPEVDNIRLLAAMNAFLERMQESGALEKLREEHFGHSQTVSRIGSHTFSRKMRRSLPPYRELIQTVAAEYQMDWHLLAAIAYQESHWNPRAESPTGVRGMMMLTVPTAEEMGVADRLDPGQSLRGGARYLKNIKRRLPDRIAEPDRTYMALAAYNIGFRHLEDARVLTQRLGGDPDLWSDLMLHLPLLQKRRYYETLKYGYARGQEAATYVQNIRHYHGILQWQDIAGNKPLPPIRTADYLPPQLQGVSLEAL